jgi:hypothetical protein
MRHSGQMRRARRQTKRRRAPDLVVPDADSCVQATEAPRFRESPAATIDQAWGGVVRRARDGRESIEHAGLGGGLLQDDRGLASARVVQRRVLVEVENQAIEILGGALADGDLGALDLLLRAAWLAHQLVDHVGVVAEQHLW